MVQAVEPTNIVKRLYQPGVGVPLTRRNIEEYQKERYDRGLNPASADHIAWAFAHKVDQASKEFKKSERWKKAVARIAAILKNPKSVGNENRGNR